MRMKWLAIGLLAGILLSYLVSGWASQQTTRDFESWTLQLKQRYFDMVNPPKLKWVPPVAGTQAEKATIRTSYTNEAIAEELMLVIHQNNRLIEQNDTMMGLLQRLEARTP